MPSSPPPGPASPTTNLPLPRWAVPRQQRPHHARQINAPRHPRHGEGYRLGAAPGAEDLHHVWVVEEGDREGGGGHQACDH